MSLLTDSNVARVPVGSALKLAGVTEAFNVSADVITGGDQSTCCSGVETSRGLGDHQGIEEVDAVTERITLRDEHDLGQDHRKDTVVDKHRGAGGGECRPIGGGDDGWTVDRFEVRNNRVDVGVDDGLLISGHPPCRVDAAFDAGEG